MKLIEMNPNFKIEEIKKLQNDKKINNQNFNSKKKETEENIRPLNSKLNKVKENSSNIFHSEVRKIFF